MSLNLSGKSVLVTGGAGFVGSHLIDGLVALGARVRVIDNFVRGGEENLADAKAKGSVELLSGDIRQSAIWSKALHGVDTVFHQAALRVNRCEEDPRECWDVMVQATFELFQACVQAKVRKVVLASSAIVYGKADQLPTPPTHALYNNSTWYGAAKIANEQMLNALFHRYGIPGIALRYFNIYGPRMATKGHTEVLVKWFQTLETGKPVRIYGDGTQSMDWVHVKDIARANILAATSDVQQGVFNVGSGVETSLLEFGRLVMKAWGMKGEPELVTSQAPVNPIPRRWADISATTSALGYRPSIELEQGLAEMAQWWKRNVQQKEISA